MINGAASRWDSLDSESFLWQQRQGYVLQRRLPALPQSYNVQTISLLAI